MNRKLSTTANICLEGKTEIAKNFKVDKYLILISKCVFLDYRNTVDIFDWLCILWLCLVHLLELVAFL